MDSHHNDSSIYDGNFSDWFISECHVDSDMPSRRVSLFLLYLLLFMGGLTLNSLVVWVNWRRRSSRNGVLFCVLNVAISDLMVMIITPVFMLENVMDKVWMWGSFLCRFSKFIEAVNVYSSCFFLAYMTVERYLAVVRTGPRPWGPAERRRRAVLFGALWVLSFVLALLENVHVRLLELGVSGCFIYPDHSIYHWFSALTFLHLTFQFVGPAAIIVTFNLLTLRAVRACPEAGRQGGLWFVHLYSLLFMLCWLPTHIVNVLLLVIGLDPELLNCRVVIQLYMSYDFIKCLSLIHCVANPIIYNFLSRSFRGSLVAAVSSHLPREAIAELENHGKKAEDGKGGTGDSKRGREMSDTSTSQM